MPLLRVVISFAFCTFLIAGCERAIQQPPSVPTIQKPPMPDPAPSASIAWTDTVQIGDEIKTEEPGTIKPFSTTEMMVARDSLEARLRKDAFTSKETTFPKVAPCQVSGIEDRTEPEVVVAFVRPRILTISPADSSSLKVLAAEITVLATMRPNANAQWRGVVDVRRDTLTWTLQSDGKSGNWAVCELPSHDGGHNPDGSPRPRVAWMAINSANTEIGPKVVWDGDMTWPRLPRLADSVAKLPADFVVEGNPEPHMPIYFRNTCPGEQCEFGEWLACDTVRLFKNPEGGSATAFMLRRNDTITALTGHIRIRQAGKVVFTSVVKVDMEGTHAVFTPADTLYPLMHGGEGFGSWYFRGRMGGGYFFFGDADEDARESTRPTRGYSVIRRSAHEWWVQARNKKGEVGWFTPTGWMQGMAPRYEEGKFACTNDPTDQ